MISAYTVAPLPLSHRTAHERLTQVCFIDYDRELALVAEQTDQSTGKPVLLGVARLCRGRDRATAEIAVIVADPFQNRGLGTELVRRSIQVASAEQIGRLSGLILAENRAIQDICRKLGFRTQQSIADPSVVTVVLDLV